MVYNVRPNFIGIGVQKCASTWLYRILEDHPDVFVSEPKELDFFSCHFVRGYQWYLEHFKNGIGYKAVGEISPSYFHCPDAPRRIRDFSESINIILTIRDPIERAYSQHLHCVRLGFVSGSDLSFESAVQTNPTYVDQSRYSKHIDNWLRVFSKDQICIFLLEDIKANPVAESQRLYRFLSIDEQHRSRYLKKKANVSQVVRSDRLEKVLRTLGRAGRRLGMRRLVEAVKHSAPVESFRQKNRINLREIVPPMREETVAALREAFEEDVCYVKELLNRDSLPWRHWQ